MSAEIGHAVANRMKLAVDFFDRMASGTKKGRGVCRSSYGEGENFAHRLVAEIAAELGLEVSMDAAANTYMTLPGRDRTAPRVIVGSHLDSVDNGGNFDGAAGVIAGLVAVAALKDMGVVPEADLTVMGVRAEESVWFGVSYIGSRAALGLLPEDALATARSAETGHTLADHIRNADGNPDAIMQGAAYLSKENVASFLEVHIEQGPILEREDFPIGLVSGIRGNFRFPEAAITGEYSHCGGVPRKYRKDTVFAGCDLVRSLNDMWIGQEERGNDLAITIGKFFTNPDQHAMTKIPGELQFSIDVRSLDEKTLASAEEDLSQLRAEIEQKYGVKINLGRQTLAPIGVLDSAITASFEEGVKELGLKAMSIPSGAAHDAAAFAAAGVPAGMIFVRNRNGSHNPDEQMEIDDLREACTLLAWHLKNRS